MPLIPKDFFPEQMEEEKPRQTS